MAQPSPENMNTPDDFDEDLRPTTEGILRDCPRFRILLIGKSGVGKSSLVNKIFKVNLASVSDERAGVSDINRELAWPGTNPRFVLHDSLGFEAGEVKNLKTVKTFVEERIQMPDLKDRLHAIWLCIAIPTSGGRVSETGNEEFLKFIGGRVPIIAVFTKYDKLVSRMESEAADDAIDEDIEKQAEHNFEQLCIHPLKEAMGVTEAPPCVKVSVESAHEKTIEKLVEVTREQVIKFITVNDYPRDTSGANASPKTAGTSAPAASPNLPPVKHSARKFFSGLPFYKKAAKTHVNSSATDISNHDAIPAAAITTREQSGDVSVVWAMAQRASAKSKIDASIKVGAQKYWRGISFTSIFKGKTLEKCLHTIHRDIITVWNFHDPERILDRIEFKAMTAHLVSDLAGPETPSNLATHIGTISSVVVGAILGGTFPPVAAVAVPLGLLVYWTATTLHDTCGYRALHALMGYILHLTNIMQHIFYRIPGSEEISRGVVEQAFKEYSDSATRKSVDTSILDYFDRVKVRKIAGNAGVLEEMIRLIDLYRFVPQQDQV